MPRSQSHPEEKERKSPYRCVPAWRRLIDESLLVFEVQYRLSGYYGGIKDGSYVLNTAQTVDEMLEILAGVNTEGQPSAE